MSIKGITLKPLNGEPAGAECEYNEADFKRLEAQGAVKRIGAGKAETAPANKMQKAPANKAAKAGSAK